MDRNSIRTWAEKLLNRGNEKSFFQKDRLLILLLTGVLLLVVAFPVSGRKNQEQSTQMKEQNETAASAAGSDSTEIYASYMEQRLEKLLSQVSGVGKTKVMVTIRSTSEKVVEKDEETSQETTTERDSQGGTRTVTSSSSSGTTVFGNTEEETGEQPYITKELSPAVEGVVVIAQGGDDPATVQEITEAVQALFQVDTHKIKVMKLNENKEVTQ